MSGSNLSYKKLTGEKFESNSANQSDDARLDISARGFGISGQKAFFDVRVFNPLAKRYRNTNLQKCYEQNEKEKKKKYNERVLNVEQGSFTPIVMSSNGGLGREATKCYARLAEMLADKRKTQYSIVSAWVKRKLSFSLIRSVTLCLRGSRSLHHDVICNSILSDIALSENAIKNRNISKNIILFHFYFYIVNIEMHTHTHKKVHCTFFFIQSTVALENIYLCIQLKKKKKKKEILVIRQPLVPQDFPFSTMDVTSFFERESTCRRFKSFVFLYTLS